MSGVHLSHLRANRRDNPSARLLAALAELFGVPISYFFEGLADPAEIVPVQDNGERMIHEFLLTREGLELARTFSKIRNRPVKRRVLEMVRTLAGEDLEA